MPKNRKFLFCRIAAVLLTGTILFSSCSDSDDETPAETVPPFTDEDLAAQTGININFPDLHPEDPQETETQEGQETAQIGRAHV